MGSTRSRRDCVGFIRRGFVIFAFSLQLVYGTLASEPFKMPANKKPEQIQGEIDVWAWNIAAGSLVEVIPKFNESFPNVKVNVHMTGAGMQSRFLLSLSAGVGAPDVMQLEIPQMPRYSATKRLTDLTLVAAHYEKDFIPSFWESCVHKGRLYGIPWGSGPCAVFYKLRVFERYGIDPNGIETWDDYIAVGKALLEKSNGKTKMLHLPTAGIPSGLTEMFEIMIQQNGGQIFDGQGQIAINSPQCLQVMNLLRRMLESGITSNEPHWTHAFYASMKSEAVATYPLAAWFGGTIKDYAPETSGSWGVFRLPALEPGGLRISNLGGSVLVIPDQCEQKEAAWVFVEFVLCRPEIQNIQYKVFDLIPCLIPSFDDPFYDEPDPFYAGQKVRHLFTNDIEKIYPLNRTKDWEEARVYLSQALSKWARRTVPPEQFLIELETRLSRRLGRKIAPTSLRFTGRDYPGKNCRENTDV